MSFVHPLLLGGLLLVGIPVLIHLIMQQKPKRLPFPAFRFLLLKQRTNQRRLRLRHFLLLALRVLLIAALCLALARPKLFSNRLNIGTDRPVAAVLLFDTSLSMGYQVSKQTRLDEAKKRALELVAALPPESRIVVLDSAEPMDSAEPGGDWLNRARAEERITALKLRPVSKPLTRQIRQAFRMLSDLDQEQTDSAEALPRILCVFSDRTLACWDASEAKKLQPPDGLNTVFVDVGVENPVYLAIPGVEVPRQVVHLGEKAELRVTVNAVGEAGVNDLVCLRDGENKGERQPVQLAAGASAVKSFERKAAGPGDPEGVEGRLPPSFHQFGIRFDNSDALPSYNVAFATVKVQEGRRILIVTDDPRKDSDKGDAGLWRRALKASHEFPCDLVSTKAADSLGLQDLNQYEAICLLNVAIPSDDLWNRLDTYVRGGKGLAVVLGGKDWQLSLDAYNKDPGRKIIGVKLDKLETLGDDEVEKGEWRDLQPDTPKATLHPLVRYFRDQRDLGEGVRFTDETLPRARSYWKTQPDAGLAEVIATYADKDKTPAMLEHRLGTGRVLLLTTAFDGHKVGNLDANNYFASWFGPSLTINVTGYLAGDAESPKFNFICGQPVTVRVPASSAPSFTLWGGPDLAGVVVQRAKGENLVRITQAVQPGNYYLLDPKGPDPMKRVASFSLNAPPEESQLDRVPVEQIEALLGPGCVLTVERGSTLADAVQGHWLQPLELFPWLMILVLLVLAVENLLANKFYKQKRQEEAPSRLAATLGEPSERALAEARG